MFSAMMSIGPHSSRSDMKRMRNAKQLTAEPDSMLSAADDPNFDKLIRVVFSLLRCGRFEEVGFIRLL